MSSGWHVKYGPRRYVRFHSLKTLTFTSLIVAGFPLRKILRKILRGYLCFRGIVTLYVYYRYPISTYIFTAAESDARKLTTFTLKLI